MKTQFYHREISLITGCTIEQAVEVLDRMNRITVKADLGALKCSEFSELARNAFEAINRKKL